jgi:hypothetical protein
MKTQIVYKVVHSNSSYVSARYRGIYEQTYNIGKTTSNPKMPLFAFKTLNAARHMAWTGDTILKCKAVLSPRQPKTIAQYDDNEAIKLFWKQVRNHKKITVSRANKGTDTVFCSYIIPLEVVEW